MDKSDTDRTKKFESVPNSIDICNYGSSHGLYGFNYEDVENKGYSCFNFALVSQYITYDYRIAIQYENRIHDGTIVFIPISYFSFFGKGEEAETDFDSKNKRYYTFLTPKLIKQYDFKTDIYTHYIPVLGTDTTVLANTFMGKGATSEDNDYNWMLVATNIDVNKNAEAECRRHIIKNKIDDSGNRIFNSNELDALYSLIDFCKEKGAIPILITTPYLAEYTNEVKKTAPDFYDEFYSIVNTITKDTKIPYYDYAFDERFSNNYEWFMNTDHLNKEGARQFTNILMDEIISQYF